MKAVELTSLDTDEYNHEYVYFASNLLKMNIRQLTAKFTAFGGGELKCLGTFDAKLRYKTKKWLKQCL